MICCKIRQSGILRIFKRRVKSVSVLATAFLKPVFHPRLQKLVLVKHHHRLSPLVHHMIPTTLSTAISAVPHLGTMCGLALADDVLGSGLKVMRLVSRHLRSAMLGTIQGYTLHLDGHAGATFEHMHLLEHSRLSQLRVFLTDHHHGGLADGHARLLRGMWQYTRMSIPCITSHP